MKISATLLILFCSLTGFAQIDTSKIAIIPHEKGDYIFDKSKKNTTLSAEDLNIAEQLFNNAVDEYNTKQKAANSNLSEKQMKRTLIDPSHYKRQYIAVTNSKGEKEIWINCFCDTFDTNWRKQIIEVDDGGDCFFNVYINITTKTHLELRVNGYA